MVIKSFSICHLILCAKYIHLYKSIGNAFTVRRYNVLPEWTIRLLHYKSLLNVI